MCCVEIVDAVVIFSSFAIDIVFLGGMTGEEGQKAVAVLVVLLLWRIARVVDGRYTAYSTSLVSVYLHCEPKKKQPRCRQPYSSVKTLPIFPIFTHAD